MVPCATVPHPPPALHHLLACRHAVSPCCAPSACVGPADDQLGRLEQLIASGSQVGLAMEQVEILKANVEASRAADAAAAPGLDLRASFCCIRSRPSRVDVLRGVHMLHVCWACPPGRPKPLAHRGSIPAALIACRRCCGRARCERCWLACRQLPSSDQRRRRSSLRRREQQLSRSSRSRQLGTRRCRLRESRSRPAALKQKLNRGRNLQQNPRSSSSKRRGSSGKMMLSPQRRSCWQRTLLRKSWWLRCPAG